MLNIQYQSSGELNCGFIFNKASEWQKLNSAKSLEFNYSISILVYNHPNVAKCRGGNPKKGTIPKLKIQNLKSGQTDTLHRETDPTECKSFFYF